eukprot:13437885-Alexandrium_andersonii.AAC.1
MRYGWLDGMFAHVARSPKSIQATLAQHQELLDGTMHLYGLLVEGLNEVPLQPRVGRDLAQVRKRLNGML